jgi:hypothetical protein
MSGAHQLWVKKGGGEERMGELGDTPKPPGRETPAPLLWVKKGRVLGTPPCPRQGDPCTPLTVGGYMFVSDRQGLAATAKLVVRLRSKSAPWLSRPRTVSERL